MKNINRRENPRIDIRLDCRVTSPASWMRGGMHTENISRRGLLIAWRGEGGGPRPPEVGQIVAVEIELPAHHEFGQKCMHCEGIVARVSEADGECAYVALRVNYMAFRSLHDRMRAVESVYPAMSPWTT